MTYKITGSEILAHGALAAGVQFVTGYPGSPSTGTVEALLRLADERVRVEWAVNEKSAFDSALGASLTGMRALLCFKSVGLNVALDSLMVSNLAAGDGGFVILVGDDPGGWGSQNEQDSRPLIAAAEIPLLEPPTLANARSVIHQAFELSERFRVPVAVRITRDLVTRAPGTPTLALAQDLQGPPPAPARRQQPDRLQRQPDRYNVLPIHVVELHRRLQATLDQVQAEFEGSTLNVKEGKGELGIIAAGHSYTKLKDLLAAAGEPPVRILRLGTLHPLPEKQISIFLRRVQAALILEETYPYVETQVQAIAQRQELTLSIYGRHSGHVPRSGELFSAEIGGALRALLPTAWPWPDFPSEGRPRPSRTPLCEDCPYIPALEALLAVMDHYGGRDAFLVTGETGCMVRAQLPPWEIMDFKYGMGASIGLAAGLARSSLSQRIVALSGDSALLHSGLGELIDAVQSGVDLLVVVLANETTALSGGQPHPGTGQDARGVSRPPVDLAALIRATGPELVRVVDPEDSWTTRDAFAEGLAQKGVAVVIVERACPTWERQS